jgi:putative ABC transport system substrate-binding protein
MKDRRSLMRILAGAALLGVEHRAAAQKAKSFTIAYLALLPGEDRMNFVAMFVRRLNELGYVDGQNLRFVYRSAEGRPELLPDLASDLVRMKPDVLVTGFGTVAANRLQLLREIAPAAALFAVVLNPGTPYAALAYKELEAAANVAKVQLRAFEVRSPGETAPQLEASKAAGAGGLVILEDPLTFNQRSEIATLAARLRLPAVYGYREFAEAGGLMSYGTDHGAQWRRGAELVDLILKGAKPADIPVEQPTKFELVVNLRTAKALDLTVPSMIMIRADDVIE